MGATAAATISLLPAGGATADTTPIYQNRTYSFAERAADLVSRMTLAQKASEMNSSVAQPIASLGVNQWSWWNEAAHGVSCEGMSNQANCTGLTNTTSYPVAQAVSSSWDPALAYQVASQIGDEAREVETNNDLNMDFYAPVVNLMRDPRWGRSDETWSEDPIHSADMASQFVNGMQGQDMHGNLLPDSNGYYKTISTVKHYALNNSEVNRLNGNAVADERTLREYYTEQFRQIVQQAHVGSIMSSYNEVNGVPSPASVHLTDTLARETFGFGGYFTSDCDAVYEVQSGHNWTPPNQTTPVTQVTRHAYTLSAGEDLDCNTGYNDGKNYGNELAAALGTHTLTDTLSQNDLDVSLERLFTTRMELGEFDDSTGAVPWVNDARQRVPQGSWQNSDANMAVTETTSRLQLARKAGDESIVLLKNQPVAQSDGTTRPMLPLQVPSSGPFKVAVIGYFANPAQMYLGDYSSSQGNFGTLNEVNGYRGLLNAIHAINPTAVVNWFPGVVGGASASQLNTVDPVSVQAAGQYDAVIVYVGADSSTATEASDRSNVSLPGAQASLIQQVAQANPHTIVYMETGGMEEVGSFAGQVPAMLWSSYNGMRKGESLADVILGRYNPSGHLPFTWYQSNSNLPPITDYAIRPHGTLPGRTYMYYSGPVSYPFGYGLSYSTFKFSNLQVSDKTPNANDTIDVSFDVTNAGPLAGHAVPQLYVTTPDEPAVLERPIKRLEGSQDVFLAPGVTKTVHLSLPIANLAFFNQDKNRWEVDAGRYGIELSTSAADSDIQQQQLITVTGTLKPVVNVVTAKPTTPADQLSDVHDRLIFPGGSQVLPNLTVAMSDDTLYGYVTKGQSTDFPAGMTFSYSSDHPDVVSVADDGTISTTGNAGVATITATVNYQGVSKSTQFVVDNTGSSAPY